MMNRTELNVAAEEMVNGAGLTKGELDKMLEKVKAWEKANKSALVTPLQRQQLEAWKRNHQSPAMI